MERPSLLQWINNYDDVWLGESINLFIYFVAIADAQYYVELT